MRSIGNRIFNMLNELEFIDDQFDYKTPFVIGYYVDGREASCEILDAEMVYKIFTGHGYFMLIHDDEIFSICHSWADGGLFGSFVVQHHFLGVPGEPFCKMEINEYFPTIADFLNGETNVFKEVADDIIHMFGEAGSMIRKHMKDLKFFKKIFEENDTLDDNIKDLFDQMGVNNNDFR